MKKLKLMLAAMICLMLTSISASAANNGEYDLCNALGILPYEEYNSEENVTRGEFAFMAFKLADLHEGDFSYSGEVFFHDIESDHKYSEYINSLTRLGIIKGFSDNHFEPDYNLTYSDAAYTLVNILGYKHQAELAGGYPSGYLNVASSLKLFDGTKSGQYVTQKEMSKILYNTLISERCITSGNGKEIYYTDDYKETLLYSVFDVTKEEGIISANGRTSLNGSADIGDNKISINGNIFEADRVHEDLIGYNVKAYVKWQDNVGTVIAIVHPDTNVIKIADEDIETTSTVSTIKANVNGIIKVYRIKTPVIYLYNGEVVANLTKNELFTQNGYIELIDNDGDSTYDIISITDYQSCFVYSVSTINEAIVDKYARDLRLNGKDYVIYMDGEEILLSDVKKYDSISYTKSKSGDYYVLYVKRGEIISGIVEAMESTNNKVSVSGSEYEISKTYMDLVAAKKATAITLGMEASFYIDINGRIIAYENISNAEKTESYGYLIRIVGEFEIEGMYATMLTTNGVVEKIRVSPNIIIDGTRYKDDDSFLSIIASSDGYVRNVVRYSLNADEMIFKIDTPAMGSNEVENINLTECIITERSSGSNTGTWYNKSGGMADGRFYMDASTFVFQVPTEALKDDLKLYSLKTRSAFSNGEKYKGTRAFDLDSNYIARAVIKTISSSASIGSSSPTVMVKNLGQAFDVEEGCATPVIFTHTGAMLTVNQDAWDTYLANYGDLDIGDTIIYTLDANKKVSILKRLVDASADEKDTLSGGAEGSDAFFSYRGSWRYGLYYLIEATGSSFMAAELPDAGAAASKIYELNRGGETYQIKQADAGRRALFVYKYSGKVYVYDKATNKISESDISELNSILYKDYPDARVFMRQKYGSVSQMFIYK